MPVPNLLHPVDITMEVRRSDLTVLDDDFQEPIGKVVRDEEVVIQGQVQWKRSAFEAKNLGLQDDTIGYIFFRWMDLINQNVSLKVGDKVTKIGNLEPATMPVGGLPFYFYRFEYRGHYPKLGATLVKAWFSSKSPVK